MKTYTFTLEVEDVYLPLAELADLLYNLGCNDATISYSGGKFYAEFSREADSAQKAIKSAMKDIALAGFSSTTA